MVVRVRMNGKVIAEFRDSEITGRTAQQQANDYVESLMKLYPEAKRA